MRKFQAPSCQVKTDDSSADCPQIPKDRADPSTSSALLPARTKRKFTAPALVAPTSITAATAGIAKQVCKSLPVIKDKPPVEQSEASAQYFSVLYTKRAANKVTLKTCLGSEFEQEAV